MVRITFREIIPDIPRDLLGNIKWRLYESYLLSNSDNEVLTKKSSVILTTNPQVPEKDLISKALGRFSKWRISPSIKDTA
jgi:hypothetical protein